MQRIDAGSWLAQKTAAVAVDATVLDMETVAWNTMQDVV